MRDHILVQIAKNGLRSETAFKSTKGKFMLKLELSNVKAVGSPSNVIAI